MGQDNELIGIALVLVAVTFTQTIWGDVRSLKAGRSSQGEPISV